MLKIILGYKRWLTIAILVVLITGLASGFCLPVAFAKTNDGLSQPEYVPQPSGCWMTYCVEWVPGHYDSACLEVVNWTAPVVCAAACAGLTGIEFTACVTACINAARYGCYVPTYCGEYGQRWMSPCPE